jgi:hypothetical protein
VVEDVVGGVVEVWAGEMQALRFVPVGRVRVYHFNYKREDQYIYERSTLDLSNQYRLYIRFIFEEERTSLTICTPTSKTPRGWEPIPSPTPPFTCN